MCIIRHFKGPKAMPLDVVYAIRPMSGDDYFTGAGSSNLDALEPKDSAAPDYLEKLREYQHRCYVEKCAVVVKHLRSWNLIVKGGAILPFDNAELLAREAPAMLILDIQKAIRMSLEPDPETGNTPVEDVAKKSTPPSDSP